MADIFFGEIDAVNEGDLFPTRVALMQAGVHRVTQAGIDADRSKGAASIVLSGGYTDDIDFGDIILYTGHGGQNDKKKQIKDQSWEDIGNRGLLISEMHGLPVRVTRGANHNNEFSPKQGYQYSGLYQVTKHFQVIGQDKFLVCRFQLEKIKTTSSYPYEIIDTLTTAAEPEIPKRIPTTYLRIVRDTKLSRAIKELYEYKCQICMLSITARGVGYAEGAHIRPLGLPHYGRDHAGNLFCLCPNHHVMLDKGVIAVDSNKKLLGIDGEILVKNEHVLDKENLQYHRNRIFIN